MAILALFLLLDPSSLLERPAPTAAEPFAKVKELQRIDYGSVPDRASRFFDPTTMKVRELLPPDFTRD